MNRLYTDLKSMFTLLNLRSQRALLVPQRRHRPTEALAERHQRAVLAHALKGPNLAQEEPREPEQHGGRRCDVAAEQPGRARRGGAQGQQERGVQQELLDAREDRARLHGDPARLQPPPGRRDPEHEDHL